MGKKTGSPQVTVQNTQPWPDQANYLKELFHNAQANYKHQVNDRFFPGQTYANFNPIELDALNLAEQRARGGSSNLSAVRDYSMGILNNSPEAMQNVLGPRVGELLPQLQSQFNRGGMGTSSLARGAEQELISRELSKLKESAADRLERLIPQEYADISKLAAVGETRRDMDQQAINEAMLRHQYGQDKPWELLRNYAGMLTGNYGDYKTETQRPRSTSRLSGLLGGGLGGAALGAYSGFDPLTGGILGGLGGLF